MISVQELVVHEAKIKKAIQSGIPLSITTYTLPHEVEVYIEQTLDVFLKTAEQSALKYYVTYCVQELAVNAKKANMKRVYFMEKGLDLTNSEDYAKGMASFKNDTFNNLSHYLRLQKEHGLYIRLFLQIKLNTMFLEVRNNVVVTAVELERIHEKMALARKYDSMEDALSHALDDSEGAGLGLIILMLMLKKMGLTKDCFDIIATGKETIARLTIPLEKTRVQNLSQLSLTIVENVNALPQFPENIARAQKLIGDPKAEMKDIARQISMDPALTGDLLKLVNSAQYMLVKRVDNIACAVKLVGIQGIKNLLYSYGTQRILGDDTQEKRLLWEHSYRTAFYAYNLIKNFKENRGLQDDVYVAGILHDMGKIIFSNVHPDLHKKINDFCADKNLPASTLEDLSAGMNHAEIGALVADKWNFPDEFVQAIRFHHDPLSAPPPYRELTDAVYLANMFCEYENNNVSFEQFEPTVLESFGICSKKHIDGLLERFSIGFQQKNERTALLT
ncbi:MAG: HDOD domain-containing protein [Treponema sp.]|jgi:putative nucleotidyltransferase with HDIG domain|nr:HDOD domain-containing protein [Treponema sp.]